MTDSTSTLDLVIVAGQPVVSSLRIAEHFEKKHYHVLRDIQDLLPGLPKDFRESNFGSTEVDVPMPTGGVRKSPAYNLTRDGFTLLAMGFTGKQALAWKIRYIEAFNAMEERLREQAAEAARPRPIRVPAGKRPRPLAKFQDQDLIDLLLAGHSQAQAARELGVSETSVYKRLRRLEAERVIRLVRAGLDETRPLIPPAELGTAAQRLADLHGLFEAMAEAYRPYAQSACLDATHNAAGRVLQGLAQQCAGVLAETADYLHGMARAGGAT